MFWKKARILFLLLFVHSIAYGANCSCKTLIDTEFKVAAFIPQSSIFREIYGFAPYYQFETSYQLKNCTKIWINTSYYENTGRSIGLNDPTKIKIAPFSFGFKNFYKIGRCLKLYYGLGASYSWVRIENDSLFVRPLIKKNAFGGVLKLGATYSQNCFFSSCFVDYQYQKLNDTHNRRSEEHFSRQIGGFLVGFSIGRYF